MDLGLGCPLLCPLGQEPLRVAALQFPLAHPAVTTVVVGARTPAEAEDTLSLFTMPVPADLWETLKHRGLLREDAPVPTSEF